MLVIGVFWNVTFETGHVFRVTGDTSLSTHTPISRSIDRLLAEGNWEYWEETQAVSNECDRVGRLEYLGLKSLRTGVTKNIELFPTIASVNNLILSRRLRRRRGAGDRYEIGRLKNELAWVINNQCKVVDNNCRHLRVGLELPLLSVRQASGYQDW